MFAGDTIYVLSDTYAGVAPDTFKLQDQPKAVDNDALLLHLVAQQSRELFVRDSLRQDSLLADLRVRDSLLQAELAALQDSIRLLEKSLRRNQPDTLQELASAEVVEVDSLQMEIDSVMHELADKIYINRAYVEKSIFRDIDADLEDIARALRDKYSHWYKEANLMAQFTKTISLQTGTKAVTASSPC